MTAGFWLSFLVLCAVQGLLVLVPRRKQPDRFRLVGVLVPAGLLVIGVLLVRDVSEGARFLTDLATFGTPVAAGLAGYLLGWRRPWLIVIAAVGLYMLAWRGGGLVSDAASVGLIALACLSGAALAGRLIGRRELVIGLVLLVCLDVILVFATSQVTQTTDTLHAVVPPTAAGHPLPALQDVTFGSALMGWLDFLAPALLGVILVASPRRRAAALATFLAALAWGCLLYATPMIPATVPILVGLIVGLWPRTAATRPRATPEGAEAPRRLRLTRLTTDAPAVIVDLTSVEFISSAGLHALLRGRPHRIGVVCRLGTSCGCSRLSVPTAEYRSSKAWTQHSLVPRFPASPDPVDSTRLSTVALESELAGRLRGDFR